ncbi:trafficking protein particle complex subunit 12 [Condylostylus longicornis]|uniref:trafficking protein particle complex subunit 12 n=1 Tax=Condylostylus longicornis TaxID=2530218 RepID=UPI00244DA364|nr:trafficking protein particle complex subunit 12 [Condylostylus longicornis]
MENQPITSSTGPSLSQYFANDPPSLFDEISQMQNRTSIISDTFDGSFQATEYIENSEEELKVTDDVRNSWEPPNNENSSLTSPGIPSQEDLPDHIHLAAKQHLSEIDVSERKILTADDVTQDERGLRKLIAADCYRSAINLTGRLLKMYRQGYGRPGSETVKHTPHSLQLWFTRLALLIKLGRYDILQAEAEPFGSLNRPDIFFEYYPDMYDGKKGSMACFSFRVLLAEVPIYTGSPKVAIDNLTELASICNEIKNYYGKNDKQNINYEFWRRRENRVLHSIINCAVMMREFGLIDDIIKSLFEQTEMAKEDKRALFSAWGRIYLQIGDVFGAEQKFSEARRLKDMNSTPDLRDLVDKGLIAVAQNDFQEAFMNFQKALHLDNQNTMLLNNMGVCLLYCGKLKDAIHIFESSINMSPQQSLNESLLINLSTLYELESSNSKAKKLKLLKLINKFKPDLNISLEFCLKLQTNN